MEQQEINEGYYLVTWPSGNANEPTNVFWGYTGGLRCFLNGDYHDTDSLCKKGYTFTPLVALTSDVVEALMGCVVVMEEQGHTLTAQKIRGLLPKEGNNND